jgi:hypothetical protein
MPIALGGAKDVIDAVKAAGGRPGPLVAWFGSWTMRDYAAIDRAVAQADSLGVPLLAQAWFGGDQFNKDFLNNPAGTWDPYQGIQKTRAQAMQFFHEIGARTAKARLPAIVVVETEANKGGIEKDPASATYLVDAMDAVRGTNPKAQCVLAPGDWQDLYALATGPWKAPFLKADGVGARTMRAYPRNAAADLAKGADALLAAAQTLRRAAPGKPVIVTDFAVGSYGGDVATTHPFGAKSNPSAAPPASAYSANDSAQKTALERLVALRGDFEKAGVANFCYRGLRDASTFDVKNYYGYAERTFGVVRADGSRKPGYAILLSLSMGEGGTESVGGGSDGGVAMPDGFAANFVVSPNVNENWVEVKVTTSATLDKVEAVINSSTVRALPKTAWGTYGASYPIAKGSTVVFRATDYAGKVATSQPIAWLAQAATQPAPAPTTTSPSSSAPAAPSAAEAKLERIRAILDEK